MRLEHIRLLKERYEDSIQILPKDELDQRDSDPKLLIRRESVKRALSRSIGLYFLQLQQSLLPKLKLKTAFSYDLSCLGERFSTDASHAVLLNKLAVKPSHRVLVAGCNTGQGEDVQFWLRRGFRHVDGIDLYSFEREWPVVSGKLGAHFNATVAFRQAAIENMPYPDDTFDLLVSNAMLEHIHNVEAALKEIRRVLKQGGLTWHAFGPLYFGYAGDHCISSHGLDHGYDHLLLDEANYRKMISDQAFYDTQPDPRNNFWAVAEQFSFLKPNEYISLFTKYFNIEHLIIKISSEGLWFKEKYPDRWNRLKMAGVSEEDLLISGMLAVLRKKE